MSEFESSLKQKAEEWKLAGVLPADALRMTEKFCVTECYEFHPRGPKIVEEVYGGTFRGGIGGSGVRFFPAAEAVLSMFPAAPAPVVDATPEDVAPVAAEPIDAMPVEAPTENVVAPSDEESVDVLTTLERLEEIVGATPAEAPDRTPASTLSQMTTDAASRTRARKS